MNNKLGITNEEMLNEYIDKLVDFKMNMLNQYVTFNCKSFDLEYLLCLHKYLFGDVYDNCGVISDRYNEKDYDKINVQLSELYSAIEYSIDVSEVEELVKKIILLQMFDDGNNRTIISFAIQIANVCCSQEYIDELTNTLLNKNTIKRN